MEEKNYKKKKDKCNISRVRIALNCFKKNNKKNKIIPCSLRQVCEKILVSRLLSKTIKIIIVVELYVVICYVIMLYLMHVYMYVCMYKWMLYMCTLPVPTFLRVFFNFDSTFS